MLATSKPKSKVQAYLDWLNLGYEFENKQVHPPVTTTELKLPYSDVKKKEKVELAAKSTQFENFEPGNTYAQQYVTQHKQDYKNLQSELPTVTTDRQATPDDFENISSASDTECDSTYKLDTIRSTDVYCLYDFSKYNTDSVKLPVSDWKKEILEKIETYSVVIIEGKTGCGKSTQVPQFILDNAVHKMQHVNIVVTQPRKIAAISLARRVCAERGWTCGTLVGYQVGLNNETDADTRLSFVTTEVLVQRIIHKRSLNDYTHIILDEVHERDEHTDFALLIVKKLLHTVSRNIKIILMSASVDCNKFAKYYSTSIVGTLIPAPIIKVADEYVHRLQIFYLNWFRETLIDKEIKLYNKDDPGVSLAMYELAVKIIETFDEIERKEQNLHHQPIHRGAVLIFLPGLYEIESLFEHLRLYKDQHKWECIPLHSTLTMDEQQKVFAKSLPRYRKIIVSTNIAESSITVPDVKYVIDFCLTKTLHCDPVTNYTFLKLTWASKASCIQRAGRAGRVSSGRVYRLIDEECFQEFEAYITPELCRTPLTKAVLKTKLLDMGPPETLLALALDPPNLSEICRTILILKQIGALGLKSNGSVSTADGNLTLLGKVAANLPIDPHLSKLIVLGHIFGCLKETIIIAASLSLRSFHSTPFQDELKAFHSKISWAYGSFSDCLASYEAYKRWEDLRGKGAFHPLSSGKEKNWARHSYIQINDLKDVNKLVREIENRLHKLNIQPIRADTENTENNNDLILQICIAGAFYPNYFKRSIPDDYEKLICSELNFCDCFRTVVISGLPPESNFLYGHQLREIFKICSEDIEIFYEGRKAYIQFLRKNEEVQNGSGHFSDIPGDIPVSVYRAIKMKQVKRLRESMVLKLYSAEETEKLMEEAIVGASNPADSSLSSVTDEEKVNSIHSSKKQTDVQHNMKFRSQKLSSLRPGAYWDLNAMIQQLHGPRSPLEMKFVALNKAGCCKNVTLDRNSVNSVILDSYPETPFDRMIVSSFVVLNPNGSAVTLRSTTLMPSVPGMLSLCLFLFAPVAELRLSDSRTAYRGALFGLGFNSETGSTIYPDDDIEVAFDFNFTENDLREVNIIRALMSSTLHELDEISPNFLSRMQKSLRSKVTEFLNRKREYCEPVLFPLSYKWNQIPEGDILYPQTETGLETKDNLVFPLHNAVKLEEENCKKMIYEKVQYLRQLESRLHAEKASSETRVNEICPICAGEKLERLFDLRLHLLTPFHTSKEWQILSGLY